MLNLFVTTQLPELRLFGSGQNAERIYKSLSATNTATYRRSTKTEIVDTNTDTHKHTNTDVGIICR